MDIDNRIWIEFDDPSNPRYRNHGTVEEAAKILEEAYNSFLKRIFPEDSPFVGWHEASGSPKYHPNRWSYHSSSHGGSPFWWLEFSEAGIWLNVDAMAISAKVELT